MNRTPLHDLFRAWGARFWEFDGIHLPRECTGVEQECSAAGSGAALFDGSFRAWLEVRGRNAGDFLHRMLTSDVRSLPAGGGQWSAALDAKAHWVSDSLLYRFTSRGEAVFGLDLPASRAQALCDHLGRHRFREDVRWQRRELARLLVLGPGADAALREAGVAVPSPFGATEAAGILVLGRPDRGAPAWEILGETDAVRSIGERLHERGAIAGGSEALEVLRIAAGEPRFGADFDAGSTLPDSGEWQRVSLGKGCYPGQEVVARVRTYGAAPWQLCRLEFDGPGATAGAKLVDEDGSAAGRVTSAARPPGSRGGVGLALLRRRFAGDGRRLWAACGQDRGAALVRPRERRPIEGTPPA